MKRREFIILLGGAATCPLAARAQQPATMRRVAVLLPVTADDPDFQARVGAFLQGLQEAGWSIGRNLRINMRWVGPNANDIRRHVAELVALAPDVILPTAPRPCGPCFRRAAHCRWFSRWPAIRSVEVSSRA